MNYYDIWYLFRTVVINWGILIKEFITIKNRLISEGYIFLKENKLSNEYIICIIQFMFNTIIPIFNIFNIISIVSMKNEIYNLIKTILILDEIIEYDNKIMESNINDIETESKIEEKTNEITRIEKIQKLKDKKNKLLSNPNEKIERHVLTKHHQTR